MLIILFFLRMLGPIFLKKMSNFPPEHLFQAFMFQFISYLSFLTSGLGIFFTLYLGFRYYRYPLTFWLISVVFALVYIEFYTYALTSRHILKMLFLFRSANLLRAILPIHLLFYVKGMLNPDQRIKPVHYLHYLFPLFVLIGIMPDLLLNDQEKISILENFYLHPDYLLMRPVGFFPPAFLQPSSMLIVIAYACYILYLIFSTVKKRGEKFSYVNKHTLLWLKLITFFVIIYFGMEFVEYRILHDLHIYATISQWVKCILGISLFSFFITSAQVQENMDGCILPKGKSFPSIQEIYPQVIPTYLLDSIAVNLDKQVKESKAYLSAEYDLSAMAKALEIPISKLPKLIKKYYGISFVEFINRLRIHHFLEQRSSFDQFTLETYMYQSGFTNRSTFYAAFKKYVGVNPSYYLKEMAV